MVQAAFVTTIALASLLSSAAPPAAQPLFDAMPYDAWRVVGGAASFELVPPANGGAGPVLVGRGPIPRNGFLTSPRELGDFRLKVDVRIGSPDDPKGEKMNSGIQIRSRERDGRIVGLQVEVDPSPRAWSAGIYDEGGRLWLAPLDGNEAARVAFRRGEWNTYEIEAIGPRIRTTLNGVRAAEWYDGATAGRLAFQVHGGPACEVAFRAPVLEELGTHAWQALASAGAPARSGEAPRFRAALDASARGVRMRIAGEGRVALHAGDASIAEVSIAAPIAPAPSSKDAKPATDDARLVEFVWIDGAGAALLDGRKVADLRCASAPTAVRVDGAACRVTDAEQLAQSPR
ncbi:MAG: DUF1080 domain-containing protein [Planctomycetota bacterium]